MYTQDLSHWLAVLDFRKDHLSFRDGGAIRVRRVQPVRRRYMFMHVHVCVCVCERERERERKREQEGERQRL